MCEHSDAFMYFCSYGDVYTCVYVYMSIPTLWRWAYTDHLRSMSRFWCLQARRELWRWAYIGHLRSMIRFLRLEAQREYSASTTWSLQLWCKYRLGMTNFVTPGAPKLQVLFWCVQITHVFTEWFVVVVVVLGWYVYMFVCIYEHTDALEVSILLATFVLWFLACVRRPVVSNVYMFGCIDEHTDALEVSIYWAPSFYELFLVLAGPKWA